MTVTPSRQRLAGRRVVALMSRNALLSAASLGGLLVLWWAVTSAGLVSRQNLPSPADMVHTFGQLAHHGYQHVPLYEHVLASLKRCLIGFAIGSAFALPLGLLAGYYRAVAAVLSPIVALFRPVPPIAYLPLLVLFLGIGEQAKIFLIATGAFFYMLLNTEAGVRGVSSELVDAGRMLGLSRRQLFTSVVFRGALPQIIIGVNVSLVLSWAIVVAAELVAASRGLGYMAVDASTYYRVDFVYAAVVMIGVIGAGFELIVRVLHRRLVPWHGR
jgi:NitT/TauT family transport system permease protein